MTHITNALAIVQSGEIASGLVFDESILRKRRIEVTWVSPNHWFNGYRYGHIAFALPWKQLIHDKRFYWVESLDRYSPPACRILITDVDRSNKLLEYDPEDGGGPWRFDRKHNQHHWNGDITMEFMIETDISLDQCTETRFVDHHESMCSLGGCREMRFGRHRAGSEFIGAAIGRSLDVRSLRMTRKTDGIVQASSDLRSAANELISRLSRIGAKNARRITRHDPSAKAITRAVMHAWAIQNDRESRQLAALFTSPAELAGAAELLLRDCFDLSKVSDF